MKNNFKRIIKMTAFYSVMGLILQSLLINILFASSTSEAQNLKDIKISVQNVNTTLEQAFQILEKKADIKFMYFKDDNLPLNESVKMDFQNETLYNILVAFAKDYNLSFNRINDQIIVKKTTGETESVITTIETGSLRGYVTDADSKEPLQGVTISVKGTTIGTFTDKRGYFEINNLKPGKYTVSATYVGYSANSKNISIVSGKTAELNFQLGQSAMNLDEVVVTGSISDRTIKESANPIAILTSKQIETKNLTFLADVLSSLPGISAAADVDGSANYGLSGTFNNLINIRGTATGNSYSPSIKYFLDGVEVYNASTLNFIDPNAIERIEVSKGPMSSTLYGAGSSAGIIQVFTKKGKGDTQIEFKTMYTSREDIYAYRNPLTSQYSLSISGGKSDFGYRISGNYGLFPVKRYAQSNGVDERNYGLSGNVFGNVGNIKMQFGINYGFRDRGAYATPVVYYLALEEGWPNPEQWAKTTFTDTETKSNDLDLNLNIKHVISDNIYQNLTLGLSNNTSSIVYNQPTTSASGVYYPYYKYDYSKQTIKYFANWAQPVFTDYSIDITGGVDVRRGLSSTMVNYYTTPYTEIAATRNTTADVKSTQAIAAQNTSGVFGEGVFGYKNSLYFTSGFRLETDNSYGENTGWYPMSRFGLTYVFPIGNFTFKPRASYGKSTESVNPSYKVDRIVTSGSDTYHYTGNKDLKPQIQTGYETGMDIYYGENYSFSLTLYYQKVEDMITQIDSAGGVHDYYYKFKNLTNVVNKGFELSAKAVYDQFTIDLNYSYVDSRYGTGYKNSNYMYDGGRVVMLPSTNIFARLSYRLPQALSLCSKRGDISLEVAFKGSWLVSDYLGFYRSVYAGKPNPNYINSYLDATGYALLNLNISYPVLDNLLLYTDVKNLLNYQNYLTNILAPMGGRRITFGFKLSANI